MHTTIIRKLFYAVLAGVFLFLVCAAQADSPSNWTCTNCGQTGNQGNFCPNCGAPAPSSSSASSALEQIPGETNRVKVRLQSVSANSYIVNRSDPSKWIPEHAVDGIESSCWQFSSLLPSCPPWLSQRKPPSSRICPA